MPAEPAVSQTLSSQCLRSLQSIFRPLQPQAWPRKPHCTRVLEPAAAVRLKPAAVTLIGDRRRRRLQADWKEENGRREERKMGGRRTACPLRSGPSDRASSSVILHVGHSRTVLR